MHLNLFGILLISKFYLRKNVPSN